MHSCLTATGEATGTAGAVLLRALEPLAGVEMMRARGDHGPESRLLSGPGKIGRAFGLNLDDNGRDFTRAPLVLAARGPGADREAANLGRTGISRAGEWPYRFAVVSSRSLSRGG